MRRATPPSSTLATPGGSGDGLATRKIAIETTAPTVSSVSTTETTGTYGLGATIPITVTFSEAVDVTGTPQLALNDGGTANYVSGSGTATLTFDYEPAAAQDTSDLDYASTTALTTPTGSSIEDAASNAATLTLPTPAGSSDTLATQDIIIKTPAGTGIVSGYVYLGNSTGFGGVTVQLTPSSGDAEVTQSAADGSYSFSDLPAGTYDLEILPSSKYAVATTDDPDLTLTSGQESTSNDFTIQGPQNNEISLRMFLVSTTSLSEYLTSMHSAPSVSTGSTTSTTYTTYGSGVAIDSGAKITSTDSPTLSSMTVTIENPQDGSSEKLTADSTDLATGMTTSNPSANSLEISGYANVSAYQSILSTLTYSDTATSATAGDRTISIVVNDGTDNSSPVTVTVDVVQGTETAPTVTAISPESGPTAGGTSVTITGSNFTGARRSISVRRRQPIWMSFQRRRSRPTARPARAR